MKLRRMCFVETAEAGFINLLVEVDAEISLGF